MLVEFFWNQIVSKRFQILHDEICPSGLGDNNDVALRRPAQEHLCGGLSVLFGHSADDEVLE